MAEMDGKQAGGGPQPGLAVVIPYFQRQPGLLRRAVDSVTGQVGLAGRPVRVIIVDDASPCPAAADLDQLALPLGITVEVISKANGGPGSARNAGIDRALALGCAYLAFLDSDDWWEPQHLATALAALERGTPFYFANSMHDDVPSFSYFKAMRERQDASEGVIPADEAFGIILAECVPHTSQVAYSLAAFPQVRFDETMRRSGEDHLFWLTIAESAVPLAFSNRVMGHRGRGVSVYREALGWDAPGYLARLLDAYHFRTLVQERFRLSRRHARINARYRQDAADEIAFALVRRLARSPRRAIAALTQVRRAGPGLWAAIASALPRLPAIRRRVAGS